MTPVPDWWLERLAAGDLPPERAAEIRARLAAEPGGEARLAEIDRSNQELLARFPAKDMARRIRVQAEPPPPRAAMPRWFLAVPAAALAAALVLVLRAPPTATPDDTPEITRVKGPQGPSLSVHRQTTHGPERLAGGAAAHPRDRLQLSYAPGGARYGALLSIDGRGGVTLHLPRESGPAAALSGGEVLLPDAYELDDAPGFERFFFIYSSSPFAVEEVLSSARALAADPERAGRAPLSLPPQLGQVSILLPKVSP
jgi:hypothetical protein